MRLTDAFLQIALLGAEWVMWLLVALSFVSVAIMIERALYLRARRVDGDLLSQQLSNALRTKNPDQAMRLVRGSPAIECVVLAAGLSEIHRGIHAVSEAMLSAKARERLRWEAYLPILATLGSNAPFIGLLGTVLGIIKASKQLAEAPPGQQQMASAAMGGVFEALVATAVGLFVAIPAVMAYNFFQRLVRTRIGRTDALAHQLLSLMKADASQPAPAPPRKAEQSPAILGAKRDAPPVAPPAAGHLHPIPPPPAPDQSPPVPPPTPDESLPFSPPRIQQVP